MKDNRDFARSWLEKARSDLNAANQILDGNGPYDTACFHAQKTIEKALKGFLAFSNAPIPRTHDLEELQRTCNLIQPVDELIGMDFSEITDFAVQLRYDVEFWPEREIASQAQKIAAGVLQIIENHIV